MFSFGGFQVFSLTWRSFILCCVICVLGEDFSLLLVDIRFSRHLRERLPFSPACFCSTSRLYLMCRRGLISVSYAPLSAVLRYNTLKLDCYLFSIAPLARDCSMCVFARDPGWIYRFHSSWWWFHRLCRSLLVIGHFIRTICDDWRPRVIALHDSSFSCFSPQHFSLEVTVESWDWRMLIRICLSSSGLLQMGYPIFSIVFEWCVGVCVTDVCVCVWQVPDRAT